MFRKKCEKKKSEEKVIKEMKKSFFMRENLAVIFNSIATLLFAAMSLYFSIPELENIESAWKIIIIASVSIVAVLISVWAIVFQVKNYYRKIQYEEDYQYYSESKRVSTALLSAIKRTDFAKTCDILQSTYGSVPHWNPINYEENVLVYDVHQHLRNICIRLKELIVELSPDCKKISINIHSDIFILRCNNENCQFLIAYG